MGVKNIEKANAYREKREQESKSNALSSNANVIKANRYRIRKSGSLDTLWDDLDSTNNLISNSYSGWQDKDTMSANKQKVSDMQKRLSDYNEAYGMDFDDTQKSQMQSILDSYNNALSSWDETASLYDYYQNADAFNAAMEKQKNTPAKKSTYEEKYANLKNNADYTELSKYQAGKNADDNNFISSFLNEARYKYANEGTAGSEAVSNMFTKNMDISTIIDNLTDDERNAFNYIYNKEGGDAAYKYLDDIGNDVMGRELTKETEDLKNYISNNSALGNLALSAAGSFAKLATFPQSAGLTTTTVVDPKDVDTNRGLYGALQYVNQINPDIADTAANWSDNSVASWLLKTGTEGVTEGVASRIGQRVLGGVYNVAMGTDAYLSKYADEINNGSDQTTAVFKAGAAGLIEYLTEQIGMEWAFEKPGEVKNILKTILKQAGAEGSEEVVGNIATALTEGIYDVVTGRRDSDIIRTYDEYKERGFTTGQAIGKTIGDNALDTLEAFVAAALSAGAEGGVHEAITARSGSNVNREALANVMISTDQNSEAYRDYLNLSNKYGNDFSKVSNWEAGNLYNEAMGDATEGVENSKTFQGKVSSLEKVAALKSTVKEKRNLKKNYNVGEKTTDKNGQEFKIANVIQTKGGNVLLQKEDGSLVTAEDTTLSEKDATLVDIVKNVEDVDARKAILEGYTDQNMDAYEANVQLALTYGRMGFGEKDLYEAVDRNVLSNVQITSLYAAGKARRANISSLVKANDALIAKHKGNFVAGTFDTSAIQNVKLNTEQTRFMELARAWSSVGVNMKVIYDTSVTSKNGKFINSKAGGLVVINLAARPTEREESYGKGEYVVSTMAHELTHWMQAKMGDEFNLLVDTLHDYYGDTKWEKLIFDEIVNASNTEDEESKDEKKRKTLSRDDAISEVVARACEDMLNDMSVAEEILNTADKTTVQKIYDAVMKWFKEIKDFFNDLMKNYGSDSEAAALIRENQEEFNKVQKMWTDMFKRAIELNQAQQSEIAEKAEQAIKEEDQEVAEELVGKVTESSLDSLKHDDKLGQDSIDANNKYNNVDTRLLTTSVAKRKKYARLLKGLEYLLPEDIEGNALTKNDSYGKSVEHALICVRSLVNNWFVDSVAEELGRPLSAEEQIVASEILAGKVGNQRECQYCYVAADRRSYKAMFKTYYDSYVDLRNTVLSNKEAYKKELDYLNKNYSKIANEAKNKSKVTYTDEKGKEKTAQSRKLFFNSISENVSGFLTYLDGKDPTKNMLDRYMHIVSDAVNGVEALDARNFTTEKKRQSLINDSKVGWYIKDATAYSKAATKAKLMSRTIKVGKQKLNLEYVAYNGNILKMDKNLVEYLNGEYGLRMYSDSDYVPAFLLEDMQIITDAAVRGLKMLEYTKDIGCAKVFAPSGMNINISTYGILDPNWDATKDEAFTKAKADYLVKRNAETRAIYLEELSKHVVADAMQGADWKAVQELRDQYRNVGAVFVATNDDMVEWALAQDWIDVVIPYHTVFAGLETKEYFKYSNYKDVEGDVKTKDWDKDHDLKSIPPTIHGNNLEAYKKALKENHLTARFAKWLDNPNYMKLVNETRLAYNETPAVQPEFDWDAADEELARIPLEGKYGYLQGYSTEEDQRRVLNDELEKAVKFIKNGDVSAEALDKYLSGETVLNSSKRSASAPTFYSKMSREIDAIKQPKIGAASVVSYLKGKGVKDEEIKWSGIETFLEGKKSVTKEELQEFARNSMLQIEESTLDEVKEFVTDSDTDEKIPYDAFLSKVEEYAKENNLTYEVDKTKMYVNIDFYDENKDFYEGISSDISKETHWSEHTTKGTENYREILFKLPGSTYTNDAMNVHWGEEGVLAHARIDDANGGKMLFVEEIQSDWHNAGNKSGYGEVDQLEIDRIIRGINQEYKKADNDFYDEMEKALQPYALNGSMPSYIWQLEDGDIDLEDELRKKGVKMSHIDTIIENYHNQKREFDRRLNEAQASRGKAPDAPFKNGKYVEYVMKRLIRMAAEDGYDSIGWTTAKMQEERWSDEYAEGYRIEYDQDIPKFMTKYGKQWGAKVEQQTIESGDTVWTMKLTDSMKDSVLNEGQALYSTKRGDVYEEVAPGKLGLTDEKIDKMLSGGYYGATQKGYAQAYIAYMSPDQFLSLTSGKNNPARVERLKDWNTGEGHRQGEEFDFTKFADKYAAFPIHLNIDENDNTVVSHEGRHRMWQLKGMGYDQVPVLLFNSDNLLSKKPISSIDLMPQTLSSADDEFTEDDRVTVTDLVPFGQDYADTIKEKFGSGSNATLFSTKRKEDDIFHQNDRLQKENDRLKQDVFRLSQRLKLEGEVTKGKVLDDSQITRIAKYFLKSRNSEYDLASLKADLRDIYGYILDNSSEEDKSIDYTTLMVKAFRIADKIANAEKARAGFDSYYKGILDEMRASKIKITEEQKRNLGSEWHKDFFGKLQVSTKEGRSAESVWNEWVGNNPGVFDSYLDGYEVSAENVLEVLPEVYDDIKKLSSQLEKTLTEEDRRILAAEIYNKFWSIPTVTTISDKYDKQIKRLKFEHRQAMDELRQSQNAALAQLKGEVKNAKSETADKVKAQRDADTIYYNKIIHEMREQKNQKIAEYQEYVKKRNIDQKEAAKRRVAIEKITNDAKDLWTWMNKNDGKNGKSVPDALKPVVKSLLEAINFSSRRALGLTGGSLSGTLTQKDVSIRKALEKVHNILVSGSTEEGLKELELAVYFPPTYIEDLEKIASTANDIAVKIGGDEFVLNEMTSAQLEDLYSIVKTMKNTVKSLNDAIGGANKAKISTCAQNDIQERSKYKDSYKGRLQWLTKFFKWSNTLPYYAFKHLGGGAYTLFENLMDGWDKFAFQSRQIVDFAEKTFTGQQQDDWSKHVNEFTVLVLPDPNEEKRGAHAYEETIRMTDAQVMSLYCLYQREHAKGHIASGGIVVADFDEKGNKVVQTQNVRLSKDSVEKIISVLDKDQIRVADALQKFMSTTCSDWMNEVTMKRWGIKGATEEHYFPIQVDSNITSSGDRILKSERNIWSLLNASFTKPLVENAKNPIEVDNIFDVFTTHASEMNKYNSLALPILDMIKYYNYSEKDGAKEISTKGSLKQSFGDEAKEYILNFLGDLNGNSENRRGEGLTKKLTRGYKTAAVGFNLQVAALQPISIMRATDVIGEKYIAGAMVSVGKIKHGMEMCQKYSGIAVWKDMSLFDTNLSRGLDSKVKQTKDVKSLSGVYDKTVDASMKLAEKADNITWGAIWNACEAEQRDKTGLTGEELMKATAKRFREVIYSTQVVDSTMTRTDAMRAPNLAAQWVTAFMSEPSVSVNVLTNALFYYVRDAQILGVKTAFKNNGRLILKAVEAYTLSALVEGVLRGVMDKWRDWDEDETVLENMWSEFLQNMLIFNNIPIVKDVISIFQGYSVDRMDMASFQSAYYAYKSIQNNGITYKSVKRMLQALSQFTGIPAANAIRELTDAWNNIIGNMYPDLKIED